MSTVKCDTLAKVDGLTSVPVNTIINGTAKAWVNFTGIGTVSIRASFNVSSITDNGVGAYTVNYTNAMPDANGAVQVSTGSRTTSTSCITQVSNYTSSIVYIQNYENNALTDIGTLFVAVFR